MTKPSLQEIADMPHTDGVKAMRAHYDPKWPMVTAEPLEEGVKTYSVTVSYWYSVEDEITIDVEAEDEESAGEIAIQELLAVQDNAEDPQVEDVKAVDRG